MDMARFSAVILKHVGDFVQPTFDALAKRIDEREDAVRADTSVALAEAVAALPVAKDGKDADPEQTRQIIAEAVAALPAPLAGKDCDMDAVREQIASALSDIQVPQDGAPGKDADPVDYAKLAEVCAGLIETEVTKRMLDFERRAQDVLIRAVASIPPPKDGAPGRDGLGFDDMTLTQPDERTAVLRFARGDVAKEFTLQLAGMIDRGVFKDGDTFARGDVVSWGGSAFVAQVDGAKGAPGTSPDWRLAVRKGRDGKDGERGKEFTPPKPVRAS